MSTREQKEQVINKMSLILTNYSMIMLVRNNGITATESKMLQLKLHDISSGVCFIKNTLFCIAVDRLDYNMTIKDESVGSNLIIYSNDIFPLLKNVIDFFKDNVKLEVVSCYYDSKVIKKNDVYALSKMPSIEALYSKLYTSLQLPLLEFYNTMNSTGISLLHVLQTYKDKEL
ncbi:large subunit ribosomal protein L10 [Candidatus Xenohaliotis californiensis]|uniref:Large ribosomal subunit protein uL10 n=1 Tax=Candidatus Xenohaliotis californiensis TaxID=84677 RepID=A0ABP0EW92_9RICK|nr:large subunit ribosomal protein L10 [Candidatus Xenohaliotis californiensis]